MGESEEGEKDGRRISEGWIGVHRPDARVRKGSTRPSGGAMTTDLTYLAFTAMLTGSLWIPYVISQVVTNGLLTPANM